MRAQPALREFLELTADIVSSRTEQEIMQKMEAAAHALHCDQVLFGIEVRQPLSPVIQSVTSCYPQRYQELYWEQGFVARDPVVAHCQSRTDPIRWSESMYDANSFDIMEESKAHGLAHGFSIPVRESDRVVSMISLARDQKFTDEEHAMLLPVSRVLATSLHVAHQRIVVPAVIEARRPNLSPRELECIKWAALGKSNSMIADILAISEATVAFHVKGALRKLNVATRLQAVSLCIALGLIV